jgi:hypothetical protein
MDVSLHGGLLEVKPRLKLGQNILVVNSFTEEERECRVVYIDSKQRGRMKVAVEFANADGDFWHVYSPPIPLRAVPSSPEPASQS